MMPVLIVVGGPSGAGKTSTAALLEQLYPNIVHYKRQITTRKPRPSEIAKSAYVFVSDEEIDRLQQNGELLVSIEFVHHRYAFDKELLKELHNCAAQGKAVVVDSIHSIKPWIALCNACNIRLITLFLYSEQLDVLKQRIEQRQEIEQEAVILRLDHAQSCLSERKLYQCCIDTTDFNTFEPQLRTVVEDMLGPIASVRR